MLEDASTGKHGHEPDAESLRRDERDSVLVVANIRPEDGSSSPIAARVRNVSLGGLMAEAPEQYRPGLRITIKLEGIGATSGIVAWSEAGRIGIAFDHPIDTGFAASLARG